MAGPAGSHPKAPLAGRWWIASRPPGDPAPPADHPDWVEVGAPGTAAACLRRAGAWSLDGPARDFDATDWWWRASFDAAAPGAGATLGFDGVATIARAWLNGSQVLDAAGMFAMHQEPVADRLCERGNELLLHAAALQPALAVRRPRPRWRTPMVSHQQLRWWRTTLLGRTPGWSPPAAPVGPWRDVWLDPSGLHAALSPRMEARLDGVHGHVRIVLDLGGAIGAQIEGLVLTLSHGGHRATQPLRPGAVGMWSAELAVPHVHRWWPHTHGEPHLYRAALSVRMRDGTRHELALGAIGFRELALDTDGGRLRVVVNGQPVFCRGALWTPLDIVSLRSTPEQCRQAVQQVRRAGMNMLRIAGTQVYEEDHFYAACDEAGILVWQDFMFANMDYPDDEAFVQAATQEARQQLQRLHAHPSLAVLCGNSEVEQQAAMWGAPRELWQPALFHSVLPALCRELAPGTPYWPSSAHGGAFPHVAAQGSSSYYGVGAYRRPLDDARRSGLSFATEALAFANIPEPSALARMPGGLSTRVLHPAWKGRSPRDLGAGWDFDEVRDHYVRELLRVDPVALRQWDHERYLALGRLAVGEVMSASFGEWRRAGSGCGGALVLSLRDLWAGAGWGLLDDAGQPKSAFHALARQLQPVAVWFTDEGVNGVDCHLANDTDETLPCRLELSLWRGGDERVAQAACDVALAPRSVQALPAASLFEHFMDVAWAYRFGPPPGEVLGATLWSAGGEVLGRTFHFPLGLPVQQEPDIGLEAHVLQADPDSASLRLQARRVGIGIHFDVPGWCPDDAWFHLLPGEPRLLRLLRTDPEAGAPRGTVHAVNSLAAPSIITDLP